MHQANQAATQRALVEKELLAKQVSALRAGLAEMSADTEDLVGHLRDRSAAIERLTSLHDSKAAECAELQLKCSVLEEARRNAIQRIRLSPAAVPQGRALPVMMPQRTSHFTVDSQSSPAQHLAPSIVAPSSQTRQSSPAVPTPMPQKPASEHRRPNGTPRPQDSSRSSATSSGVKSLSNARQVATGARASRQGISGSSSAKASPLHPTLHAAAARASHNGLAQPHSSHDASFEGAKGSKANVLIAHRCALFAPCMLAEDETPRRSNSAIALMAHRSAACSIPPLHTLSTLSHARRCRPLLPCTKTFMYTALSFLTTRPL
jgi:hypothetical protein